MAEITKYTGKRSGTIAEAGEFIIGNVGVAGGTWTVHLESSSFSGTIQVKARATKPTGASAPLTEQRILYRPLFLNNSVAASSDEVSTEITNTSIIQIPIADGLDLVLDCTVFTSGSMSYQAYPSS